MSISAYASSLSIPAYPASNARTADAKPPGRDPASNETQTPQTGNRTQTSVPSTGLLNTVV